MNRETFIERMIELYKKGGDTRHLRMCAGFECNDCPAHKEDDSCYSDELLIDEIIRLKRETNLEHYTKETGLVVLEGKDYMEVTFMLPKETRTALEYQGSWSWLLSPYEEPKRYQMSQLCYDMIAKWTEEKKKHIYIEDDDTLSRLSIRRILSELNLYDESWEDVTIKDLLENAEVVEE